MALPHPDEAMAYALAQQFSSPKLAKEAFVSGLQGGSIGEINLVTLIAPTTVLLWSALQSRQSFFTPYTPIAALVDFLLNCAAILSATTIYSAHPELLNYLLVIPALLVAASTTPRKAYPPSSHAVKTSVSAASAPNPFPVKPFITAYRGTMLVVTAIAILAVDFHVFPRRFAKVENWGTSLMDLGVGSFVFSAGVVAARPILKQQVTYGSSSLFARLRTAMRHALPLLILGFIRLYSVKGLDYQEHVTEYGVHWNFFFTLSLIQPLVAIFDAAFSLFPSYAAFALLVAIAYELCLDFTDLGAYIFAAPRVDLLSSNREGIFSLFGYLAIYLAGQSTGMYSLPRRRGKTTSLSDPTFWKLFNWSIVWIVLYLITTQYVVGLNLTVSRRLANLPYVLWIAAFNTTQIMMFAAIENFFFPDIYVAGDPDLEKRRIKHASSRLLAAFNRNGLAVFLVSNLGTGIVNMTVDTLALDDLQAFGVLLAYIATLSGMALYLDANNISIKL